MKVQILNSFRGDDVRELSTEDEAGREGAAKLLAELLKSGSAIFFEKEIDGKTHTYRVNGYDKEKDRLRIVLAGDDPTPPDAQPVKARRGRPIGGSYAKRQTTIPSSSDGTVVSVAPVSGGSGNHKGKRKERRDAAAAREAQLRPELSWESVRYAVDQLCVQRGWHHGCPMPSSTNDKHTLVVARGTPMHEKGAGRLNFFAPELLDLDRASKDDPIHLVNHWYPTPTRCGVYRDSKGTFKVRWPIAHERLSMLLDSMHVRAGAVDSETELIAMTSLAKKITRGQWDSYILSGSFPEKSSRSGVTYILRKGLPTLAITERPREEGGYQRHFLAALCLHPLAYYERTFAGSQPPTDEVIGHLMMIRADEHFFWRKAGQHPIEAMEAGV